MQNLNETEYIKKIILDKEALLQALPENVKNILQQHKEEK